MYVKTLPNGEKVYMEEANEILCGKISAVMYDLHPSGMVKITDKSSVKADEAVGNYMINHGSLSIFCKTRIVESRGGDMWVYLSGNWYHMVPKEIVNF